MKTETLNQMVDSKINPCLTCPPLEGTKVAKVGWKHESLKQFIPPLYEGGTKRGVKNK